MSLLRSLSEGLRALFRKERVEVELDEELRGFLEMAAKEKMKQGMSRKESCASRRVLGTGKSRSYEGSRPLCRLGMSRGDVVARFALCHPHAPQVSRFHRCCCADAGTRNRANTAIFTLLHASLWRPLYQ